MKNNAMACARVGSLTRETLKLGGGVYKKFWVLYSGSMKNFHSGRGGLGKFSEFCTISTRYPPPIINDQSLKGPRVYLVGVPVTGLMETPPPWHVTRHPKLFLEATLNFVTTSIVRQILMGI